MSMAYATAFGPRSHLRVTLAVLALGVDLEVWTHAMEMPKEKLYTFKKDELLNLKLATDVGGKTVNRRGRRVS